MNGWPIVRVGELADQIRGVSYAGSEAIKSPQSGYVAILRANNITDSGLLLEDFVYVPKDRVGPNQYVQKHDVLIAASSGSLGVVGKAAQAHADLSCGFGAFCKVLRPSARIHPDYFSHFFKTADYRRRISYLAAGANINNLRNEHLDDLDIPLPPFTEQKRIAKILDQAEALRATRGQALAKLDTLTQSLFLDLFGDPRFNPKGFAQSPLGVLIKVKSGESAAVSQLAPNGTYPVYGGNGINGYHDQYMFESPMIVIGRVGAYCGAVHLTEGPAWVTDNALFVQHISPDLNITYLAAALKFANLNQYAGRAAQPLVSGSRIYPVEILVPPLALQEEYANRITIIKRLKGAQNSSHLKLDALFASLQHRAFRGEL